MFNSSELQRILQPGESAFLMADGSIIIWPSENLTVYYKSLEGKHLNV